ncbi:hypothetical protein AGDE_03008 [Angomonas deanei]|nr:hypothetical protein AGDE_03008 [Angomonas deanei]|eukprot:EPY40918.1 hypothetical protein AGDE_03008 [Angomonas deanei]
MIQQKKNERILFEILSTLKKNERGEENMKRIKTNTLSNAISAASATSSQRSPRICSTGNNEKEVKYTKLPHKTKKEKKLLYLTYIILTLLHYSFFFFLEVTDGPVVTVEWAAEPGPRMHQDIVHGRTEHIIVVEETPGTRRSSQQNLCRRCTPAHNGDAYRHSGMHEGASPPPGTEERRCCAR